MMINGFRARVLDDGWCALLIDSKTARSVPAVMGRAEPIKAAERRALCERADRDGFDKVVVERHIYATYDLRCVMKSRHGTLVKRITALKNAKGVWFEVPSSKSNFY